MDINDIVRQVTQMRRTLEQDRSTMLRNFKVNRLKRDKIEEMLNHVLERLDALEGKTDEDPSTGG